MRALTRFTTISGLTLMALLLCSSSPANAGDNGEGHTTLDVAVTDTPAAGHNDDAAHNDGSPITDGSDSTPTGNGCQWVNEWAFECVDATTPPPNPQDVADVARDQLPLDVPPPHTSPPEDKRQLVGIPTWYWLEPGTWHATSATASLGGVTATVTATPVSATWDPGDGAEPIVCHGPGRPYSPQHDPTCAHTYDDKGRDTIRVTVTWHATWTSSTGATGTQADVTLTTTLPITITDAQAVTD